MKIKEKVPNPSLQLLRINATYPDLVESYSFKPPLYINLRIKPTESSRTYLTQIKLTDSKKLEVFVLNPNLAKENKGCKSVPHMYSLKQGRICLYLPKEIDYTDNYSVAAEAKNPVIPSRPKISLQDTATQTLLNLGLSYSVASSCVSWAIAKNTNCVIPSRIAREAYDYYLRKPQSAKTRPSLNNLSGYEALKDAGFVEA